MDTCTLELRPATLRMLHRSSHHGRAAWHRCHMSTRAAPSQTRRRRGYMHRSMRLALYDATRKLIHVQQCRYSIGAMQGSTAICQRCRAVLAPCRWTRTLGYRRMVVRERAIGGPKTVAAPDVPCPALVLSRTPPSAGQNGSEACKAGVSRCHGGYAAWLAGPHGGPCSHAWPRGEGR